MPGDDRQVRPLDVRGAVSEQAVAAGAAQAAAAEVDPRIRGAADTRRLCLERGPRLAIARYFGIGDPDVQEVQRGEVPDVQAVLGIARDDAVADVGDELPGRAAAVALSDVAAEAYAVVAVLEHRVPHHERRAVRAPVVPGHHAVPDVERDRVGPAVAGARRIAAAHAGAVGDDVIRDEAHRRAGAEVALLEHVSDVVPERAVPEIRDDLPVAGRDDRLEPVARRAADSVRESVVVDGVVDLA